MSWQSYVDDQLIATQQVKQAIICDQQERVLNRIFKIFIIEKLTTYNIINWPIHCEL